MCATKYVQFFRMLFSTISDQISDLPVSGKPGCRCNVLFRFLFTYNQVFVVYR